MSLVVIGVATWLMVGVTLALVIGRAIHQADVKAMGDDEKAPEPNVVVDLAPSRALATATKAHRFHRPPVPPR